MIGIAQVTSHAVPIKGHSIPESGVFGVAEGAKIEKLGWSEMIAWKAS
jgi:hypothetical protein